YALFAQADYDITDKLSLILGLRQTWDRKKLDPLTLYGFGAGVPEPLHGPQLTEGVLGLPASQGSGVAKFNKLTPKAGIQYQVNDDFMVFASYSVGYNTGGFNTRAPSISLIGPYDPETLK